MFIMFTVQGLKKDYKSIAQAKTHFGVTARGWETLVAKLNSNPTIAELQTLRLEIAKLRAQLAQSQPDPVGFWLLDGNFDRSRFTDFSVPKDAFYKESIARAFHKGLARRFHPDTGGSDEQMANLNQLLDQLLALVEMNEGLGV
jgi:hypothetical protein